MVWLVKAAKIYLWFGSREGAPVWCTAGAGGQRARSLGRHLEVGLGKESKERRKGGRVTMQLDGCVATREMYSFTQPLSIETDPY